jgi:hypothetical protein
MVKFKRHTWSTRDILWVKQHARLGAVTLARHFKVSANAVRVLAHRRGIALGPPRATLPPGTCVECRQRPVYTASDTATELELCEVCYKRWKIHQKEEELLVDRLDKRLGSLSGQMSKGAEDGKEKV